MMKKVVYGVMFVVAPMFSYAGENRTEVGASLGTPSGINFVLKKDISGFPVQVSGFYLGEIYGIEAGYSFYRNESSHFRSVQIVVGTSVIEEDAYRVYVSSDTFVLQEYKDEKEWNYLGVSTTFQFGGFYIEPGLSAGSGDYSSPQLSLQLGWLWSL